MCTVDRFGLNGGNMTEQVTCVLPAEARLGEVPVWSQRDRLLYWVDIRAPALHALNPVTGHSRAWPMPEAIGAVALHADGGLLVALASGLARFDPSDASLTLLRPVEADIPTSRLNDGRCDRQGRFWFGSMDRSTPDSRGFLYRYDPDGSLHRLLDGIEVPNGLAFSPDGGTMYFCDSPTLRLQAFALDPVSGDIVHAATFVQCEPPGVPDGAVTDSEGCLWVAHFGGARLTRYRPDGHVDRVIPLPVERPTACCFGGENLDTLFVTSSRQNLDEAALRRFPLSGAVFAIRPGVRGLPEPIFGAAT
jgi:sugar lactone lactonase YvrE